eukprot:4879739-Alexandrium_andersonii.AAC.1
MLLRPEKCQQLSALVVVPNGRRAQGSPFRPDKSRVTRIPSAHGLTHSWHADWSSNHPGQDWQPWALPWHARL